MEMPTYELGGLRIASNFPLFGLPVLRDPPGAPCEVVIRWTSIPEEIASAAAKFLGGHYHGIYNGKEVLLDSPSLGRFLVREGKEIIMDLVSSADDHEVRAYLLGAAFGALCHQRGIVPLHASTIDIKDGCVAFIGASGAGKSTLVAALAQRGHEITSDDECFLQLGTNEGVMAWPGIGQIKLWEDARAALGFEGPGVQQIMQGYSKFIIPVRPPRKPRQSRPLRRVYQLHRIPNGVADVTRLRGVEAVEALMQNVYPPGLAEHLGYQSNVLMVCAAAVRNAPVFQLSRPLDFAALAQGVALLENHLQATP